MSNERLTEKLMRETLITAGFTKNKGWSIEEQQSKNKQLKFTSKANTGNVGNPEFIVQDFTEDDNFVIVIECKAELNNLVKFNDSNEISTDISDVQKFAVNGAYHYALDLNKTHNVLFIGAGGEYIENFRYDTYYLKMNDPKPIIVNDPLTFISHNTKDFFNKINGLKTTQEVKIETIKLLASDIHEYMRDECGISNNEKALVVSALLLALDNNISLDSLKGSDKNENYDGVIVVNEAYARCLETNMDAAKATKMMSSLAFVKTHETLNTKDNNGSTKIKNLTKMLIGKFTYAKNTVCNIYTELTGSTRGDLLGIFYKEFVSYNGGDGKGLGIVLTPDHITELMVKLIDVDANSIVYDPCLGTGAFLTSAMLRIFELINSNTTLSLEEKLEKIEYAKKHQLIGCELADYMFTVAATNMILQGDGKANIFAESCFKVDTVIKASKPNKALLNPPYSLKKPELRELKFIETALNVCIPESKVAALVPVSCFLDKNKALRSEILKHHTLDAVITLPADLFVDQSVGTQVAIGIFIAHKPHNPEIKTWLCEYDDGFVVVKKQGRKSTVSTNTNESKLITAYRNKDVISGYSKTVNISPEDECTYDCFLPTEKPTAQDIYNKLKEYMMFEYNNREVKNDK